MPGRPISMIASLLSLRQRPALAKELRRACTTALIPGLGVWMTYPWTYDVVVTNFKAESQVPVFAPSLESKNIIRFSPWRLFIIMAALGTPSSALLWFVLHLAVPELIKGSPQVIIACRLLLLALFLVGNLVGWLVCSSLSTLGETHDIFSKEHPLPPQARGFTVRLKANLWPLLLLFLESCAFSALLVPVSLMSYTILAGPLVTLWRWASLDARARLHQRNALLGGAAPAPTA